jgi:hypothetical protein
MTSQNNQLNTENNKSNIKIYIYILSPNDKRTDKQPYIKLKMSNQHKI